MTGTTSWAGTALTLSQHLSSPPFLSEIRVANFFVFCINNVLTFYPFSFGHCIVFFNLWLLIIHLATVLCVLLSMASEYPFGHCIVCSSIYGFWLSLWPLYCVFFYLLASDYPFGHCIVCSSIYGFRVSIWPLYSVFFNLWLLIIPLATV